MTNLTILFIVLAIIGFTGANRDAAHQYSVAWPLCGPHGFVGDGATTLQGKRMYPYSVNTSLARPLTRGFIFILH